MERTTINTLLIVFALNMGACSKNWMDAKPVRSIAVPESKADFRALLDETAFFTLSPALTEIASDYCVYPEENWESAKTGPEANAYTWSRLIPGYYNSYSDWAEPYRFILTFNVVIEGLNKMNDKDGDAEISHLLGEAYFYRGRTFFELASMFAQPYVPGESNSQTLGIPIRTKSNIEERAVRSSLEETYKQVVSDLRFSLDRLPVKRGAFTRPNRLAAAGLLARVYLAMEMYDSAYLFADRYLQETDALLDYNTVSPTDMVVGATDNPEVAYFNMYLPSMGIMIFMISQDWVMKYDENDLRRTVFFQPVAPNYLFKGGYTESQYDQFSGVATDEIYLIRAECLARKGKIPQALADLNKLMRFRYKKVNGQTTWVDFTTTDQTTALRKILEEREKELVLRNVRWTDLRRLNRDPRFARTFKRTIGGITYTLEPNSTKYTFPIPYNTVRTEGLEQNPGWDN